MLCLSTLNAAAKACTSKNHQWKEPFTLRRRKWAAEIKQPTTWLNQLSYFQWYDIYIYTIIYRLTLQNNRFNLSGTIPSMVEPCKTIFEPLKIPISHLLLLVGWKRFPNPMGPIIIPSKPGRIKSPFSQSIHQVFLSKQSFEKTIN